MNINEVTLLSIEEYNRYENNIPFLNDHWWLSSPGGSHIFGAIVNDAGAINSTLVCNRMCSVRPVLRIDDLKASEFSVQDRFWLAHNSWTVISDDLVLCDRSVGRCTFRDKHSAKDANDYNASDVKKFLDDWAAENKLTGEVRVTRLPKEEFINSTDTKNNIVIVETDPLPF